jgi:hypothetical protein
MKILAISKETGPIDWNSHNALLQEEAMTLHTLYLKNQVREFYFTDQGDAVLILEGSDISVSQKVVQKLPLVKQGLIRFEFMELKPYSGFSRLF